MKKLKPIFVFPVLLAGVALLLLSMYHQSSLPNLRPNGFTRTFLHHPLQEIKRYPVSAAYQKIVQVTADHIYLTVQNPQWIMAIDRATGNVDTLGYGLPESLSQKGAGNTYVQYPWVYYFSNNEPGIFWGRLDTTHLIGMSAPGVFTRSTLISPHSAIIRTIDHNIRHQLFLKLNLANGQIEQQSAIIQNQGTGGFDSDGHLLYDNNTHRLLYIELYSNHWYCLDTNLHTIYTGQTIDTTNSTPPSVKNIVSKGENQLTPTTPRVAINKEAQIADDLVFIFSGLKADNENRSDFNSHFVIDVYELKNGQYRSSFYIPRHSQDHLRSFFIHDKMLYVVLANELIIYPIDV